MSHDFISTQKALIPLANKVKKLSNNKNQSKLSIGSNFNDNKFWRDRLGIEPSRPHTVVSGSFEDYEGHQYPIQPHLK
jgi:hypothetical protein